MLPRGVLVIGTVLAALVASSATAQVSTQDSAVAFVQRRYRVRTEGLTVVYEFKAMVPAMGKVTFFKISDPKLERVHGVVVDDRGRAWAPEDFRRAADSAYVTEFGKVDGRLRLRLLKEPRRRLQLPEREKVIPVNIWIRVDDSLFRNLRGPDRIGRGVTVGEEAPPVIERIEGPDVATPEGERRAEVRAPAVLEAAQQRVQSVVARVLSTVAERLAQAGIRTRQVPGAPILAATLTAEEIERVARDPDVVWIYADDVENVDLNNSATASHRAPAVWSRGYDGSGAEVAILEDSRAFDNFWLVISDTRIPTAANVDNHATETMGNVGSWHGRYLGMARGATLYSANAVSYNSDSLKAAANWAISKGAHVINNSWGPLVPAGCLSALGRFFDYQVFAYARHVTFAAGNSGNFVNDHAMAYNILAVGAFDDENNDAWSDDAIAGYSSWREGTTCSPGNGDREEPDIAATGSRITSTRMHPPSIDASEVQGTSYAAPMVAGEAALLIDKEPALIWKPEAMRAIIMASAVNNIEGSSRLSEYDGAGGIDAYSAYLIANNGWWLQQTINPQTWPGTNLNFFARSGERLRCAVAWTSHPNSSASTDPLLSDIDLVLVRPSGTTAAFSLSWDNSYEIAETTANETGTWTCRAYRFSTTGTTFEFIGMAVNRMFQLDYDYPW